MIAMKREVAAEADVSSVWQVFRGANVKLGNWRQVTVQLKNLFLGNRGRCSKIGHTRLCVQSPLVELN